MKPITVFIDGICLTGITLKKDLDIENPVINLFKNDNYVTSFHPEQHLLHRIKCLDNAYALEKRRVWEW